MRKSRFTESQIIGILKAVEAGRLVKDVCREHSVSEATYSYAHRGLARARAQKHRKNTSTRKERNHYRSFEHAIITIS